MGANIGVKRSVTQPVTVDKRKQREEVNATASTSRAEEVWTAENIDLLNEAGTLLKKLLCMTRLPLHIILKKPDLWLTYSREENSYNLFKQYLKEAKETPGPGVYSTSHLSLFRLMLTCSPSCNLQIV